ncbi:MAG: diaminopimelate decarboxylase [Planctomycetales bacterium]|nr:diaminopimelate decarboxylase [Planctomycetales bacterium]
MPAPAIAREHGTPVYVYSRRAIVGHYRRVAEAFAAVSPLVCYSVKANPNLALLRLLRDEGAGFDVVSGGELARVLRVGASPKRAVFAGVGKTDAEIEAALAADILMFNVESEGELDRIAELAVARGREAGIALRVNPDVDPSTHRHITTGKRENKFGVDFRRAQFLAERILKLPPLRLLGVHMHIGSQILEVTPYAQALRSVLEFASRARERGHPVAFVNVGGGYGIHYKDEEAKPVREFAEALAPPIRDAGFRAILEPGRFIVGNAGILLTRVLYVKESGDKVFVVCDAGMTDLIRPALYEAYHKVWPVESDRAPFDEGSPGLVTTDVVGPVCESADFFARDRRIPRPVPGDLLAVFSTGAYGAAMASHYNSRPRSPEVLVSGTETRLIRRRETVEDLWRAEEGL